MGALMEKDPKLKQVRGFQHKKNRQYLANQGLTKEKFNTVIKLFKESDTNGDKVLDRQEFKDLYFKVFPERALHHKGVSDYVFASFDFCNNGHISLDEFMHGYVWSGFGKPEQKLEYAFMFYDLNGNGFLVRDEIREVMNIIYENKGEKLDPEDVEECVNVIDVNNDDKISKTEFISALVKDEKMIARISPFHHRNDHHSKKQDD
jgi:calcium-dependent protein kinase